MTGRQIHRSATRALLSALPGLLLAAVGAIPASAQSYGGPPAGEGGGKAVLDAVVADALRANLGLAQERMLVVRAEAEVREARGGYLPSLSLSGRYTEQSGAIDLGDVVNPMHGALNQITGSARFPTDLSITFPLAYESRVRLVQPVFNERIRAGHAAARHGYARQRATRQAAARALAAEAQTAYLDVGAARSLRRTWEAALVLVEESERVAQRLVDAGTATPDAVFRARAERGDVEQRLQEAREAEAAAARAFDHLLNRPLDEPVEPVPVDALLFSIDLTEEEAVEAALENREEIAALGGAVGAADARVRAATAAFLPDVAVALDYGFQGDEVSFARDRDFWAASLIVSWNVFNGGQDAARRGAAQADAQRLGLQREEVEDLIRLDVRQAYRAARVARDAIETADSRLAAATRTFDLVSRRYEEGLATPIEFLDARTALTGAELNRVVTVYTYVLRWVDLERAAALRDIDAPEEER
jgi:outer membrane protein TolC